jgi:hypothetical protein
MANEMVPRLLSVVVGHANLAAEMESLLEALGNIDTAKEKVEGDHRSERLKSLLGLAREATKSINPESFVNKRKQVADLEAKLDAQVDALSFFAHKFQEMVEDYCDSFPTQVEQTLREALRKLEDNQKQRESEEAAINERIAKIKQTLELCSSTVQGKDKGVKTRPKKRRRYRRNK